MAADIWRRIPAFYNLVGSRCASCSELEFPEAELCRKCSGKTEPYRFKGLGTIVTYTIIRQQFNDHDAIRLVAPSPYAIAIIKLDEGPMITAQVTDAEPEELGIGKRVRCVFRKISEEGEEGLIRYGYKFILE